MVVMSMDLPRMCLQHLHLLNSQIRCLLSAVICLLVSSGVSAKAFEGRVVGVTDGDTIKVLTLTGIVKVRLANVDCPEHNQAFGQRAKQFTSAYIFGKVIEVEDKGLDRYHRVIGEVIPLDEPMDLNHALVMNGYAWVYQRYCHDSSFYPLEATARANHVGLWIDPNPASPWEFRKSEKQLVR